MPGLLRFDPATKEGKYLVQRRDGSVPEWPYLVLGARDPAAVAALLAYAAEAKKLGYDPQYVAEVHQLAVEFQNYRVRHGATQPDDGAAPAADPAVLARMLPGRSA